MANRLTRISRRTDDDRTTGLAYGSRAASQFLGETNIQLTPVRVYE